MFAYLAYLEFVTDISNPLIKAMEIRHGHPKLPQKFRFRKVKHEFQRIAKIKLKLWPNESPLDTSILWIFLFRMLFLGEMSHSWYLYLVQGIFLPPNEAISNITFSYFCVPVFWWLSASLSFPHIMEITRLGATITGRAILRNKQPLPGMPRLFREFLKAKKPARKAPGSRRIGFCKSPWISRLGKKTSIQF